MISSDQYHTKETLEEGGGWEEIRKDKQRRKELGGKERCTKQDSRCRQRNLMCLKTKRGEGYRGDALSGTGRRGVLCKARRRTGRKEGVEDDKERSRDAQMTVERAVDVVWGKPSADAMSILITNLLTCRAPFPLCRHTHAETNTHMHSVLCPSTVSHERLRD